MSWTQTEENRIQAIEEAISDLQVALNNVASKAQMKAILNTRQAEIIDLQQRVTSLESQVAALQAAVALL